jgi:hypothetical protein
VQTDQAHILLGQRLHAVRYLLVQLMFFERQIAVAQLTLHRGGEGACILHHHVFGFSVADRLGKVQRQFGANLIPVHRSGAGHAVEGLNVFFLE